MMIENILYDRFCTFFSVPRETHQQLEKYVSLIEKWQKSVNLISGKTLPEIWTRHIIDSFQLVKFLSSSDVIVDLGSGAGLPGMVLAIAGHNVTMVESDGKKIAFLREAARQLNVDIFLQHQRVEDVSLPVNAIVTARAFASLSVILTLLSDKLTSSHKLLLLKGKTYEDEIAEAQKYHQFDVEIFPSIADASGVILLLYNINRRGVKVV